MKKKEYHVGDGFDNIRKLLDDILSYKPKIEARLKELEQREKSEVNKKEM